ncbi:hypothetical protein H5T89_00150 [bacterium]|nr:hypothetical protein [bacterium]
MPKLLVVADDLTGALDTGVQFVKQSFLTKVEIESTSLKEDADVVVLDTETRHRAPKNAFYEVLGFTSFFRVKDVWGELDYIYKKTDSTLRGNIGVELKAILEVFEAPIFFVPAYPEQGRITKNGIQYVDGKPIAESVFAKDPLNPVRKSFIPDIIKEQADIKTFVVTKDKYESILNGDLELGVYIFDAETREDLERIGNILKVKDLLRCTAGSAGFAETLSRLIVLKDRRKISPPEVSLKAQPLIVICGSINERSLKQIEYIKNRRKVLDVILTPEEVFKKRRFFLKDSDLKSCDVVVIRTVEKTSDVRIYEEYAKANSINLEVLPSIVVKRLGDIGYRLLRRLRENTDTLVVFGGDTLLSITNRMNVRCLFPLMEIEKGTVLSKMEDLFFISKAGGFGEEDILEKILDLVEKGLNYPYEG